MSSAPKDQFLLDPDVVFLNHGSFGACPRPVFEAYQRWQRELERQPVRFLGRELGGLLAQARGRLGEFLNVPAGELVFVPNATYGVNVVARSLALGPGDEVLATDHEYGACDKTWRFLCGKSGATYVRQPLALPAESAGALAEQLWAGVTPRTRVIFMSQISSPTALCLPVAEVCRRAKAAGILTLIDGAHAPGQVPLDLGALGADFLTGNMHKWALAPKGAAFLHVPRERQALVEPLVVSWGWEEAAEFSSGSRLVDLLEWSGTHDPAAWLAVPAALDFLAGNDWPAVQARCHALAAEALERVCELTGQVAPYPAGSELHAQMAALPLPAGTEVFALKEQLWERLRIEIPAIEWNGRPFLRVSIQAYNTAADVGALLAGLAALL